MTTVSTQSATAYGYGQMQRQIALRSAAQLEARAASLAAAATQARKDADAAERRAGELEIQAGSARAKATTANQAVAAGEAAIKTGTTIGKQAEHIYRNIQSKNDSSSLYRNNGTAGSTYSAGSLFNFSS